MHGSYINFATNPPITPGVSSSIFVPPTCPGQNTIGTNCATPNTPCDMLKPCQNNGSCINNNTAVDGYICICSHGFDGTQCQNDNRPCKLNTCWNNGICNETSNITFECLCQDGWKGVHCETKVNYCENVTCLNNGVCRPLFLNFTCECLGTSYSGRLCENIARATVIRQVVSKPFGYIAIICLISVVLFIITMDILKYCFGIDATKNELEKIRRVNALKRRRKRPPVIQRYIYINAL